MAADGPRPLDGIRVVEVAENLAGPFAAQILAFLGADVVKVERPDGDAARGWGPPFWRGTSPGFLCVNNDKRSITLDLKDTAAVAWLVDYVGAVDVFIQNQRPGAIDELGLGPARLMEKNPRLVYCALSAFGTSGPRRLQPGYEPIVQAFGGLFSINGEEHGPATRMGTSMLDFGSGMWGAIGVLGGLVQRQRTGRGCVVDASLFETALAWLTNHAAGFQVTGQLPVRHRTGSPRLVVFQAFETKDGEVVVAAGNDRLFAKLATALGHPEWGKDPRFTTNALRVANRDALIPAIEAIMRTRTRQEWADALDEAGVPCAPINDLRDVLEHPQTAATGMVQPVPGLDLSLIGLPISFDGERPRIRRAPPALGEHNQEILGR
jgi:crotonobetainyl-CoA:carnitine CoA-transferase CaiB-like acyl-CoA transferase